MFKPNQNSVNILPLRAEPEIKLRLKAELRVLILAGAIRSALGPNQSYLEARELSFNSDKVASRSNTDLF